MAAQDVTDGMHCGRLGNFFGAAVPDEHTTEAELLNAAMPQSAPNAVRNER